MAGVAVFVDSAGWKLLGDLIPENSVVVIVASSGRPEYFSELRKTAELIGAEFLIQPLSSDSSSGEFLDSFRRLDVSLIISCSYSRKLPSEILGHSMNGGVNLHFSLLPRWRGKHPVQWAIINGDTKTGVTLHEMREEIDTGAIIAQAETNIFLEDTWLSVNSRLISLARKMLSEKMGHLLSASWTSSPQAEGESCIGVARSPEDGALELTMTVRDMHDKIRALVPPLTPAFLRDAVGNKVEFNRYFSIAELVALKYDKRALGFAWEEGELVPSAVDKQVVNQLATFSVVDRLGREVAKCEIGDYQHHKSAARVTRSKPQEHGQEVDWARFDSLFSAWIRSQLSVLHLQFSIVQ